MQINVDMDSVLCQLMPPWVKHLNENHGENLSVNDFTDWDLTKFMKKANQADVYRFLEICDFASLKPVPGAIEGMERLKAAGHEVTVSTACQHGHKGKQEWLREYLPWLDRRDHLFFGNAKWRISGDVLIDDSPDQITNWCKTGRPAIVFDHPWNRHVTADVAPGALRTLGWVYMPECIERAQEIVAKRGALKL